MEANQMKKLNKFVIGLSILIPIMMISFLYFYEFTLHEQRAKECKQALIEVLIEHNRTVVPTIYGLADFHPEFDVDATFSGPLWATMSENQTIYYDSLPDGYLFWFKDTNQTIWLFNVWEYTRDGSSP